MSKDNNKFYITTPIYYTSGRPHLGHAYTSIACDVLARWNRDIGKEVFFSTGTDEHGQKVQKSAREAGVEPQKFVDELVPYFKEQLEKLNLSYDYFIRTTDEHHKKFVQRMLQISYERGDIYKANYEGLYCIDCEQYYKEDELIEGNVCPIHKREVNKMSEENYFFKLSKYEDRLLELYEKNPDFLSPHSKAKETINRVEEGLQDISISRSKKTLEWGVELPFDPSHVTYVWFDALFNYISLLEKNDKMEFWPADVHVVGKDIMWFHKVYWPAFLMSTGHDIPKKVFAHGWWTVKGEKMGKAMGNVIDPVEFSKKYGVDEFRYFVLSNGTFGDDLNFTPELFAERVNNDLNNDFGNLVSRVHAMTKKYFDGIVPKAGELYDVDKEYIEKLDIFERFNSQMQELKYNSAIETLWGAIREANAYVNTVAPWKEESNERLATVMNILVSSVYLFAKYTRCFMPTKSDLIFKQYNLENDALFEFANLSEGTKLAQKDNLFSKVVLEKKEGKAQEEPQREGISKLNLKVGEIIEVKEHPEAEKLFVEKIDIGEDEPRQIVSGLRGYYEADELLGKKVIVVANLKPAKLRGVKSEGMILAAENEKEKVGIITTDADIGTNLACEKQIADNSKRIKADEFFAIEMKSEGDSIEYGGKEILADGKKVFVDKNIKGEIR